MWSYNHETLGNCNIINQPRNEITLHRSVSVILSMLRNIRHGQFNFHLNIKLKNHKKNRKTHGKNSEKKKKQHVQD